MRLNGTPITAICEQCGDAFAHPVDRPRRFCSRSCAARHIAQGRFVGRTEQRVCPVCGVIFTEAISQAKTCCSWECRNKSLERSTADERDVARFWAKVSVGAPDDCWEWQASTARGYGKIFWPGYKSPRQATHVAFELEHGRLPMGLLRHTCDNPPCVNPAHLVEGDQIDNMGDAAQRDRTAFGERNGQAKLTIEQVRAIRERYAPGMGRRLALEFGVSQSAIHLIVSGRNWKRAA